MDADVSTVIAPLTDSTQPIFEKCLSSKMLGAAFWRSVFVPVSSRLVSSRLVSPRSHLYLNRCRCFSSYYSSSLAECKTKNLTTVKKKYGTTKKGSPTETSKEVMMV